MKFKLPEYDNRPGPHQPLYDPRALESPWKEEKSTFWAVASFIGIPICLWLIGYGMWTFVRTLLH